MTERQKTQALRIVLIVVGIIFIFGVWFFMRVWPAGWQWQPNQHEYEQMFQGVYATLGVFLILAARAPHEHRSLILFTAWSSIVHGGIMAIQALRETVERGHLIGDVPALILVGIVLLALAPEANKASVPASSATKAKLESQGV